MKTKESLKNYDFTFGDKMNNNKKFLKVMFGKKSGADSSFEYKIDEVNVANNWNPNSDDPKEMGGFNFSVEDKILRWLVRGDTIYDVIIPIDAEIIDIPHPTTPHGVFRANKIIISNPRKVTDEMAMDFYLKSTIPEKSYYKAMAGCAIRGYANTARKIIEDKVNTSNIDVVLEEFKDFCSWNEQHIFNENELGKIAKDIYKLLVSIKNN